MSANTLANKFINLESELNNEILERKKEIHTAILALVTRKHHFQIGPPGTAKSLLVSRIHLRISGLGDNGYFHWLLTRHTVPEELFGPMDLMSFKNEGIYRRMTDNKLANAFIVFLDEIFKGNSSILNANLTAMNERLFFNGQDDPKIPLITMFAASNELPEGEELNALWDRLHFRHEISPIASSDSFVKMLSGNMVESPEQIVSLDDLREAYKFVEAVKIDDSILTALNNLRNELKENGIEVTERRWVESIGIIKGEAFLNKRTVADIEDMRPLMHVLWSSLDQRKTVIKLVLGLANPIDKEANELIDVMKGLKSEFLKTSKNADNNKVLSQQAVESWTSMQKVRSGLEALQEESDKSGRNSELLVEAWARFTKFANEIAQIVGAKFSD